MIKWQIPDWKPISLQLSAFQLGHIISPCIWVLNAWGRICIGHIMIPFYSLISGVEITQHQHNYHDSKVVGHFVCSKYNLIHKKTHRADFTVFSVTFLRTHIFFNKMPLFCMATNANHWHSLIRHMNISLILCKVL